MHVVLQKMVNSRSWIKPFVLVLWERVPQQTERLLYHNPFSEAFTSSTVRTTVMFLPPTTASKRGRQRSQSLGNNWDCRSDDDEEDKEDAAQCLQMLERQRIEERLGRYNCVRYTNFQEREECGDQKKVCRRCRCSLNELDAFFYTNAAQPWNADNFCMSCMKAELDEVEQKLGSCSRLQEVDSFWKSFWK